MDPVHSTSCPGHGGGYIFIWIDAGRPPAICKIYTFANLVVVFAVVVVVVVDIVVVLVAVIDFVAVVVHVVLVVRSYWRCCGCC